ncbi:CoA-binding protein [Helicobacter valdiviensis]|uniref:CoA-binding protein n=1 Tax=Helicobacter valdiviensis TaxID=1458358 RepID=A0A2W6PL78_9HELI|nr:CoA-binding protein [Helicobacter valdiviensis]PZT47413.1 CoA-binding protein [Helicobacter valdiviensis]
MEDLRKKEILEQSKIIAIYGLSNDPQKPSYHVAQYLIQAGYKIVPINPKGGEILGEKVYPTLEEATNAYDIDILDIFRKSEALPSLAQEIITLQNKPKYIWVQLGLSSIQAKEILTNAKLEYEENSCIKLEHQRLIP